MAQPELADVLLDTDCILFFVMVTKTRHGGILDTGKILNSGESGNQKNGKTKSGGRNGKQRPQTIQVHSSIRKVTADEYCFKCCPSCPEFSDFFAVLHIHQPCIFFKKKKSRPAIGKCRERDGGYTENTSSYARMRTFFSLRVTFRASHPMHMQWLKIFGRFCVSLKSSHPRTM